MSSTNSVSATLEYYVAPTDGSKPYSLAVADPASDAPRSNWLSDEHKVKIENLRGKEDSVNLDTAGFQFFRRAAKHTAFTNEAEIKAEYYPESIEFIKEVTGASKVVLFDHTIRRHVPGSDGLNPLARQPASNAHVDQSNSAAIARVHRHLAPDEAPSRLERRFQIINLWRPISHPALDWPLALCDYRSVDMKNDLAAVALVYPDRQGETYAVKYNPDHRWKYLKGMEPDELVLIKCFDSIQDGSVAVLTPHTAFKDPTAPGDAPLRESIEVRALVFYD